jgi:hypothetical protein
MQEGYQQMTGGRRSPIPGAFNYAPPTDPPQDDGNNFMTWRRDEAIADLTVTGLPAAQAAALGGTFDDVASAAEALNAVKTEVALTLVPVEGGPFLQHFDLVTSDMMVPKTIDLEAA